MYFSKLANGTVVSKLIYGNANVIQSATSSGTSIFTKPELFTKVILPTGKTVTFGSLSARSLINTGDSVYDNTMNAAGITSVTVKPSYLSTEIVASGVVDSGTKTATISNLVDGTFVISVSSVGYITRNIAITVSGADLSLGNKSLYAGEVFLDGIIDGSDSEALFSVIGKIYGDGSYATSKDFNLDGIIDGTDTEMLFANLGHTVNTYGESVNYLN